MPLPLRPVDKIPTKADFIIIPIYDDKAFGTMARKLDQSLDGFLSTALDRRTTFSGKKGETLVLSLPKEAPAPNAVIISLGKRDDLTALAAQECGGKLTPMIKSHKAKDVAMLSDNSLAAHSLDEDDIAANMLMGLALRDYEFDKYKTDATARKKDKTDIATLAIVSENAKTIKKAFDAKVPAIEGTIFARDLVNEPPNMLYPESFADRLKDELKPLGVEIDILDDKKMQKLGMGAILAVGKGSERKPRMVFMQWKGKKSGDKPLAVVGKGVTFDTGGISLKPGAGMEEMKMDMGGAAAVAGLMKTLALRKSSAHVIGVVALAENMPASNAYRPSDILTSLSGKTIEVINTDAEGRLVLADALTQVQREYDPAAIIDLATLTGAMMVALGHEYCGSFVNDDGLWSGLEKASAETGEKLWRMPLDSVYKKDMEGNFADVMNLGKSGRFGGACTAAGFLEHFIDDGRAWAHLDIAGTAWIKADKDTVPKFGTGFGVRVLDRLVANNYE